MQRRHYVLLLLAIAHALQYFDRQIVVVLIEPIKQEFGLSDLQIGLLTGFAFTAVYSIALIPVGYLVDRFNRRNILAAGLSVWSALTVVTGFVTNFPQLLATRAVIAGAEAVSNPSGLSILSDIFRKEGRLTAIGAYFAGPSLSIVIGFTTIGYVAQAWGWRVAFFFAGVPGLILALLIILTIKEPEREDKAVTDVVKAKMSDTFAFIGRQKSMLMLMAGMGLTGAATSGQIAWLTPFMMRAFDFKIANAAMTIGLGYGIINAVGQIAGGAIVDRLRVKNMLWASWSTTIFAVWTGVGMLAAAMAPSPTIAIALLVFWALPAGLQYGPSVGTIQGLAPPRMRGLTTSCMSIVLYLVGAGSGPLIVGAISDAFSHQGPGGSLRIGLGLLALLQIAAGGFFLASALWLRADTERSERASRGEADPELTDSPAAVTG